MEMQNPVELRLTNRGWGRLADILVPAVLLVVLYYGLLFAFGDNAYYMRIVTFAGINIIMAVSLNLINGFTGQFSIGHAGFMGVGAYIAAVMTKFFGINFIVALVGGALGAALAGLLVGLPTLRLKGDYLAIATLGFGEIIRVIIINLDVVGGPRGLMGIMPYTTYFWTFFFTVLTVIVIANFVNSTHGRACISIRDDEIAAEAMGINTTKYKVLAFTIGAGFAGLAGGLFAHRLMIIHYSSFDFLNSVNYLLMIVIGGMGSTTGSIIAAVFLTWLTEALRKAAELRMVIYSLLLIVIMLVRPQGLLGGKELALRTLSGLDPTKLFERKGGK